MFMQDSMKRSLKRRRGGEGEVGRGKGWGGDILHGSVMPNGDTKRMRYGCVTQRYGSVTHRYAALRSVMSVTGEIVYDRY